MTTTITTPVGEVVAVAGGPVMFLACEVARLRGLIQVAEAKGSADRCPWCNAWITEAEEKHRPDCEAFTESGEVR